MISGMLGGLPTLMWSMCLLLVIMYVVALMFREFFGRRHVESVTEYFDNVPRAMYTVFRCSFGDCNSAGGVPIFEHVHVHFGGFYSILYCLFLFFVIVGLFNVISAIFVESTMKAASKIARTEKQYRLADDGLWNMQIGVLMHSLSEAAVITARRHSIHSAVESEIRQLVTLEIDTELFNEWFRDDRVRIALNDLDIDPGDHASLFDILDGDQSGTLFVNEIIDGLKRLRGEPRRSDIIAIDLKVRSVQDQCNFICEAVSKLTGVPMPH